MSREDSDYYEKRAEAQLELAQKAKHGSAVQAHYELATAYLDRIYGNDVSAGAEEASQAA